MVGSSSRVSKLTAGIIVIGDEILSGRTQKPNSNFIAKQLVQSRIMLVETTSVEDNSRPIIQNILHFHKKYTYVFTTGGIGPTHDDITSESVSSAFNEKYFISCDKPSGPNLSIKETSIFFQKK